MSLHCCTALIIVVARTVVAGTGVHLVIRAKQAATSWRCCHSQTPNQTCQTRAKADYKPQEESSSSVQQLLVVVGTTSTVLTPDVLYYTLLYPTTVLLTLERLTLDAAASATTSNQTSSIKPHHHIHTSHNAFTHLHRPLLLFLPVATPDYQLIVSRLPSLSQPASQPVSFHYTPHHSWYRVVTLFPGAIFFITNIISRVQISQAWAATRLARVETTRTRKTQRRTSPSMSRHHSPPPASAAGSARPRAPTPLPNCPQSTQLPDAS